MKRLENKIAIITGGAQGIGKAAVKRFAEEGAVVIIWDVNEEKTSATINEFKNISSRIEFQKVDVTKLESVSEAAKKIIDKYNKIDILINNAGITRDTSFLKMTSEQWQQVIDVNLTGVFNCTKAVAPFMVEKLYGKIVNTSSVVGLYGNFGQTNYVATKSGIIGMTKVWARELGRKGINVNAVAPGFIATEMVSTVPEKVLDMLKERTPLGKLGEPEDIANAYLFLSSDEAKFINGAVLSVDGGLVL
ncbi:Dehydrogenase [Ignavibacterium album JCM 16511]|uniref:3-oxoacyl-[acyl-carrier-protein] reductase n=1 Tax=Ignavibacterium album (strain DSM 19864 / JCM 16511 / NBRC 101810 / Mat9-16) TaxID=945713 RepID=I0AGP4_IGNAJ|nr:3-oxoacyl-ACP reductase FabG [Ignavibacterium album]AFH48151.1 Dehydrogenase [Ignavibacterium album JCM 16511]